MVTNQELTRLGHRPKLAGGVVVVRMLPLSCAAKKIGWTLHRGQPFQYLVIMYRTCSADQNSTT
jgi:hypothetical protein